MSRILLALLFIVAGLNHFRNPAPYLAIMPPRLPFPRELVFVSGVFEILGGIGLLVPRTRKFAAWGLVALLIAVFPANIYSAFHGLKLGDTDVPKWILWARMPLQLPRSIIPKFPALSSLHSRGQRPRYKLPNANPHPRAPRWLRLHSSR